MAGVGLSVPPWMSDFSNGLLLDHNANFFRWMHVTPWKQDVESCDRVGVIQVMPAGDAEKDAVGRWWGQRLELMRDAIIYFRNNPSILFYESGNESISKEHMLEMIAIRDKYDPYGGRAMGSREMLDIREAEWGEKCFISIRVNIIRCLPQNIAEMKAYVNIGMNIVILFIKKGPDLCTGTGCKYI